MELIQGLATDGIERENRGGRLIIRWMHMIKDTQHHNYQVTPLNSGSPSTFNSCPPAVDENEVGEEDGEESVQPVARQELRLIRHQVPCLVHQRGRVFGWAQLYGCVAGQLRGYGRSGGFRVGHFKTDRIGAGGATTLALLYAPCLLLLHNSMQQCTKKQWQFYI